MVNSIWSGVGTLVSLNFSALKGCKPSAFYKIRILKISHGINNLITGGKNRK
jgi:hypothetical protein